MNKLILVSDTDFPVTVHKIVTVCSVVYVFAEYQGCRDWYERGDFLLRASVHGHTPLDETLTYIGDGLGTGTANYAHE